MAVNYIDMNRMSEIDLLSLTLRESADSRVVKGILNKINSVEELLYISIQELQEIEGLKVGTAQQFVSAMELAKRIYSSPPKTPVVINNPQAAAEYLMPQMRFLDREVFKGIYLNKKNHILFATTISIGGLSSSLVHPREVFKMAVKYSVASIIIAHNHPSGDPQPSTEDISITTRLIDAGQLLGIEILDHIILGDGRWISLVQEGLLKK